MRSADNFSATATLMNWLRATPSASDTRLASSRSDDCKRKATLLLRMSSYLFPRVGRLHRANPEIAHRSGQMMHIECHQPIGSAVDRGFQNHLVGRILQSRPPQE